MKKTIVVLIVVLFVVAGCSSGAGFMIEDEGMLVAPKEDGFYRVGEEIAPGLWESTGTGDACNWVVRDKNLGVITNRYSFAGCSIYIPKKAFVVELSEGGRWYYVDGAARELEADAAADKTSGVYTVNVEIQPGKWESTGTGEQCFWSILNGKLGTIKNYYGAAGGVLDIPKRAYEVEFRDCGTWVYQGE